jgi:thiamine transport system ATP-binding protein
VLTLEKLVLDIDGFRLTADWTLAGGARAALMGPSGAGKSTLLAAIAGFLRPASGRILWRGEDITGLPPGARPLTILFQDHNLFPHLSVAQNVGLGLRPDLRLDAAEHARVAAALARVGLEGLGARAPATLSGGQQGRVALARALLRGRPLLLLDEPFSALGPALKAEMLDLLLEIAADEGLTALMVTHDPADARRLGGQTILLDEGVAAAPADTEALFADPPPALRRYLG